MKPLIGILNNIKVEEKDGPHAEYYKINKIYVDQLKKYGADALGIFDASDELLDKFDGFLLTGGNRITENHYKVIEYAIKTNKPLIGICNGFQAIVMYDFFREECTKDGIEPTVENLYKKYDELKAKSIFVLEEIEGHGRPLSRHEIPFTEENLSKFAHQVNLKSPLKEIYGADRVGIYSLHGYGVHEIKSPNLEIIATSDDNVVEGVKYKNKPIIGTQFHPEIETSSKIIEAFINKCQK